MTPPDHRLTGVLAEAEGGLGDAFFPHRLDVETGPAVEAARRLRALGRGAEADYLDARVAGLGGDFARAAEIAAGIEGGLEPVRGDHLRVLAAYWRLMRFADAGGRFVYSEDVQIALPRGPELGPITVSTESAVRLRGQAEALLQLAMISAVLAMSPARHPAAGQMGQQVRVLLERAFAPVTGAEAGGGAAEAGPDGFEGEGPGPDLAHLVVPLVGLAAGSSQAVDVARTLAEQLAAQGLARPAASAWMRGGDVAVDEVSGPFELGFRTLNTVSATVATNAGRPILEFRPPPAAAADRARECYARARKALLGDPALRLRAHLDFREAALAWRTGRGTGVDPDRMEAIAVDLEEAGDGRAAFRARVVHAIQAELAGAPHDLVDRIDGASLGRALGAVRMLSKGSIFVLQERGDVTAAYRLRGLAIDVARRAGASQILSHELADQARFLISLGQARSGILLLQEAVGLHEPYLDAIPSIGILTDRAAAVNGVRQVQYEQLNQLVHAALSLEDLERARDFNGRLRELEERGVVFGLPGQAEEERVLRPQAAANRVLIEIHAANYDVALRLARRRGDVGQEALALLASGRDDEAADRVEVLVRAGIDGMADLLQEEDSDPDDMGASLVYQKLRSEVERGLEMLLRADRYDAGERLFRDAEARLGAGRLFSERARPWDRPHFQARLAAGLEQPGATALFEESMARMRAWAEQVGGTHSAVRFDSQVAPLVNDWIEFLLRGGEARQGLRELERFRARDFQAALLASAQLTGESRSLLSRWQRAEAAFQVALRAADGGEGPADPLEGLGEAARAARQALLAALGAEAEPRIDLDEVQRRIDGAGASLLVYHLRGSRSSVTVLRPHQSPAAVPLSVGRDELTRRVRRLTTAVRTVDPAWRPHARALYRILVEPAEALLPPPGDGPLPLLGVIPFGGSHAVPFELLVEGGRPLVSRYDLFHLPSLLSLVVDPGPSSGGGRRRVRAVGFDGERLAHAEVEARLVDPEASVGDAATRDRLLELLGNGAPAHAAVHAEPGADNPFFTLLRLADGDLYLHEIRGRPMDSPLVLLSACETAASERLPSDQITGFATTFLENGVGGVVVTRWAIDDELTVPLIRDFYRHLGDGASPARALGRAQRGAYDGGGRRAHPSFWAAFQFIGPP